jgi:hypothetical protein
MPQPRKTIKMKTHSNKTKVVPGADSSPSPCSAWRSPDELPRKNETVVIAATKGTFFPNCDCGSVGAIAVSLGHYYGKKGGWKVWDDGDEHRVKCLAWLPLLPLPNKELGQLG